MNKSLQRINAAEIEGLLTWYRRNGRDFPWRRDPDPYRVWLVEIMSQQTTMTALMPFYERFLARFPDVAALAEASEEDVLSMWAGLGYYSRARNLRAAARRIALELGGFPRSYAEWLDLPGVGPYTAAAVVSQCFGQREPVWDGNVLRVCARLMACADAHATPFRAASIEALRSMMAGHDPSDFNQALMELGALVCTPRSPSCGRCPLAEVCEARRRDAVERFPAPKARKKNVDVECRVHVRLREGRDGEAAYLEPRAAGQWYSGLWDFPSELGGVRSPHAPFARFSSKAALVGRARHQITNHRISLLGFVERETGRGKAPREGRWISLDELTSERPPVPLSTTARKILRLVLSRKTQELALF